MSAKERKSQSQVEPKWKARARIARRIQDIERMREIEDRLHLDRVLWFDEQIEDAQESCQHDFRMMRDLYDDLSDLEKCAVCKKVQKWKKS